MKAEYTSIITTYESNAEDLLRIISDDTIAMEVDVNNASFATSDTTSKSVDNSKTPESRIAKLSKKIRDLIKKLIDMCVQFGRKLNNRIRLLIETDKGFMNSYMKQKTLIKPYPNVRLITFKYKTNALQPMTRITKDVTRTLNGLCNLISRHGAHLDADVSEVISAPNGKMFEVIINRHIKASDTGLKTSSDVIRYFTNSYRGEKSEHLFTSSDIATLETIAKSSTAIMAEAKAHLSTSNRLYNRIRSMGSVLKRDNSSNENAEAVQMVSRAAVLYNEFAALVHGLYELKLEQCLNARQVLKKFYQF